MTQFFSTDLFFHADKDDLSENRKNQYNATNFRDVMIFEQIFRILYF